MRLRQNEILAATAVAMYIVFFATSPPDVIRTILAHPAGMIAVFGGALYVTLKWSKVVGGLLIVAFVLSMTRVTEHLVSDTYTGTFNETTYLAANPDVANAIRDKKFGGTARDHWNQFGKNENRNGSGQTKVSGGSSPSTTVARQYQSYANTDYTGQGDIRKVSGDVASCQTQCDSTTGCSGFARVANDCYLKTSSLTTASYRPNITHYYTGPPPPGGPATAPSSAAATNTATTTTTLPGPSSTPQPSTTTSAPQPPTTPSAPTATVPVRPVMSCNLENFASF